MTTVALMTRMGSMFTIPALLVWLVWQFGQGAAAKLRICAVSIGILLGILGLNSLLQKAYGTRTRLLHRQFCLRALRTHDGHGLDGCLPKLASEGKTLQDGEEARAKQLYSMAWENFRAEPDVFFRRLADGAEAFASDFPNVIWKGYGTAIEEPDWLFRNALTAISLIGLLYIAARRANSVELTFWALLWASIVASSSMVYFDDGSRTLAASHPLIALFFAMGLSSPVLAPVESPSRSRLSRYGSLGLIVTAALFVCVPWIAHRFSPIRPWSAIASCRNKTRPWSLAAAGCRASSWSRTACHSAATFPRFIWRISMPSSSKVAWNHIKGCFIRSPRRCRSALSSRRVLRKAL